MPHVERDAALAGIFVVELPAHVEIGHAGQRRSRLVARLASADRRHRGETRSRVALQFDLDAFGPEPTHEPRATRRSEEPRKIHDAYAIQRKRLAAARR